MNAALDTSHGKLYHSAEIDSNFLCSYVISIQNQDWTTLVDLRFEKEAQNRQGRSYDVTHFKWTYVIHLTSSTYIG